MRYSSITITAGLAAGALAQRAVPDNLKSLYSDIKSKDCSNKLSYGYYSEEGGSKDFGYCGDHMTDDGVIYITGSKGQFANMDIDCDGQQHGPGDDGRCGSSGDTQDQTAWQDQAAQLSGNKIKDLNAYVHTYVVFGNDGTNPAFDPRHYGVEPLSVMAVVCGDKLVYGIWGDTNGNDGPPLVGEAAISTATLCYGDSVNGNSGHDPNDVLYLAFTGKNAVPQGADWTAQSAADFEKSLASLGDQLVQKIGGGSSGGNSTSSSPSSSSPSSSPSSGSDSGSGSGSSATSSPSSSPSDASGSSPSGTSGSSPTSAGSSPSSASTSSGSDSSDGGDDGSDGGDDDSDCGGDDDGSDGGDSGSSATSAAPSASATGSSDSGSGTGSGYGSGSGSGSGSGDDKPKKGKGKDKKHKSHKDKGKGKGKGKKTDKPSASSSAAAPPSASSSY